MLIGRNFVLAIASALIVVIGYSLGANNSTYVAKKVKHVDELIAMCA
jgi:hypothetical protein